jgi:hypothetical protein
VQPSILSPVPVITFIDGVVTIKAAYHSQYGAPLEDAQIGVKTSKSSASAQEVTINGEEFSGTVLLTHIQASDSDFELGDDLTIIARTKEQGEWSETLYTAKTCGEPEVEIASGSSIPKFPYELNWEYADYDGFFQCRYELRIKTRLMGSVSIGKYSAEHNATIDGKEIAYAAAISGTEQSLQCELEVWSTSGLSKVISFALSISASLSAGTPTAELEDGKMKIINGSPFFLYALSNNDCVECAYSESGNLIFSLPIIPPDTVRYFVVVLDSNRFGRADEIFPTGWDGVPRSYFDYYVDGSTRRLELLLDQTDEASIENESNSFNFAGRKDPVVFSRSSTISRSVTCVLRKPVEVDSLLESLRGKEGVYRSSRGDIIRCFVQSVSFTKRNEPGIAGDLSMSLLKVSGSPYRLFYESPFFKDKRLYPGPNVFPGPNTFMVG